MFAKQQTPFTNTHARTQDKIKIDERTDETTEKQIKLSR